MAAFEVIALDPATPQLRAPGPADTYTFPRAVAMAVALPVSSGGTGTSTPSLVAGTNVTITGSWPNQTISASGGGGGGALTISNKTGAYTVVIGDLGAIINCTANTFTVSLTAAATLGAGFNCWIWNTGTGTITIDPDGAETIDGISTLVLRPGEGMQIVCNGTNWETGDKKTMRGYAENYSSGVSRPIASGSSAIAIGNSSTASNTQSVALGYFARSTGAGGIAVGFSLASGSDSIAICGTQGLSSSTASQANAIAIGSDVYATSSNSTAIGRNSGNQGSQAVTGSGAMALGGSYASGNDSFAAAIANNTSSYGAKGGNSVAFGYQANVTALAGTAIGYQPSVTASGGVAIGYLAVASASDAKVFASDSGASASFATAFGLNSNSVIYGKQAYASGRFGTNGDAQFGNFVLRRGTTDATATVLTCNNSTATDTNQVILPNNSAYAFTGTVVARQQAAGGTQSAAWKIEGLIRREGTAASTTLVASTVTAISNAPGWTLALSADTTNGGLTITATGAAATNIRWVATVQTSEVTYA